MLAFSLLASLAEAIWYPQSWSGPLLDPVDVTGFEDRLRMIERYQFVDPSRAWEWHSRMLQDTDHSSEQRIQLGLAYAIPRLVRDGREAALDALNTLDRELESLDQPAFWKGRLALVLGDVHNRTGFPDSAHDEYRRAERIFFRGGYKDWQSVAMLRQARMRYYFGTDVGVAEQLQSILELEGACPTIQAFAEVLLLVPMSGDFEDAKGRRYAAAMTELRELDDPIVQGELWTLEFSRAVRMSSWIDAESILIRLEDHARDRGFRWFGALARIQRVALYLSYGLVDSAAEIQRLIPREVAAGGWPGSLALILAAQGEWALAHGQLEFAEKVFESANNEASEELRLYMEPDLQWGMSQVARARGDFVSAYHHYAAYKEASDRRLNYLMREQMDHQGEEMEQDRMQLEITMQEMQLKQTKRIRDLTIVGFVLALLVVILLWMRLRLLAVSQSNLRLAVEKEQLARNHAFAAQQAAEESSRLKSEFLSNISHEVKTPLNALIGMISVLQEMPAASSEQKRCLETIQSCSGKLSKLLNDIIDLGRMESGRFELDWTPFSPRKTLIECIEMMQAAATNKGIKLVTEGLDDLPARAVGDAGRISQVLLNLLENAIKFTDSGEVRVRASIEPTETSGGWLDVEVEDTGIGIKPAYRDRIFKPFEQGDGSSTRRYPGSGLGLAICRHLVRMMEGKISFTSKLGKGTCFRVRMRLH